MQLLEGNNGFSQSQIIARMASRDDRAWAFPVALLDYKLDQTGYLPDGAVKDAKWSLDVDQPTPGVYTASVRKEMIDVAALTNTYFRPEVWVWMGDDAPAGANDGSPFAKFAQGIFRSTDAPETTDTNGRQIVQLTAHDLSELLAGDQLTNDFIVNVGDVITDKIKAVIAMSALPLARCNIQHSAQTMAAARTFEAGADLLTVIRALCSELNFVCYPDAAGIYIVRAWRDPAIAPVVFSYSDDSKDTLLREAKKQADYFGLPNHLPLISRALEDQTTFRAIAENKNAASAISQASLRGLDGSPLVRHHYTLIGEIWLTAILQARLKDRTGKRFSPARSYLFSR
jgi:hypothetical protein